VSMGDAVFDIVSKEEKEADPETLRELFIESETEDEGVTAIESVSVTDMLEPTVSEAETVDVEEVDTDRVPNVVNVVEREILGDTVVVVEPELTTVVVGMSVTTEEAEPLADHRRLSDMPVVALAEPEAVPSATVALDVPERVSLALNDDDAVGLRVIKASVEVAYMLLVPEMVGFTFVRVPTDDRVSEDTSELDIDPPPGVIDGEPLGRDEIVSLFDSLTEAVEVTVTVPPSFVAELEPLVLYDDELDTLALGEAEADEKDEEDNVLNKDAPSPLVCVGVAMVETVITLALDVRVPPLAVPVGESFDVAEFVTLLMRDTLDLPLVEAEALTLDVRVATLADGVVDCVDECVTVTEAREEAETITLRDTVESIDGVDMKESVR
jgi:hypothetical protein